MVTWLARAGMFIMTLFTGAKIEDIATVAEGEGSGFRTFFLAFVAIPVLIVAGLYFFLRWKKIIKFK